MNNPFQNFIARGGIWAVVQFLLKGAVIGLGLGCRDTWSSVPGTVVGLVLFINGGLCFTAGLVAFRRNLTPLTQPRPNGSFVCHGIYARVRHPLYASVILIALGWALYWQSGPALVAALALIPFFYAKTRQEERWLHQRFPDYAAYARRVPRFFPKL